MQRGAGRAPGLGAASFGLGAFASDADGRRRALELALDRVSREIPGLAFTEAESRGYPEWLARKRA